LERLVSAFYLAVEVADRPGVLASVATVFGEHGVSIRSMEQVGLGSDARLVFLTHEASEAAMAATVADLSGLEAVEEIGVLLRVVDGSDA
jgi:homoserine dehydrogenase